MTKIRMPVLKEKQNLSSADVLHEKGFSKSHSWPGNFNENQIDWALWL